MKFSIGHLVYTHILAKKIGRTMCKFAFSSNMQIRTLIIQNLAKYESKCFLLFWEKKCRFAFSWNMQSGTLGIQILAHFHDGHSALTASPTERRQPTSHLETGRDIWILQQIFEKGIFEFYNGKPHSGKSWNVEMET